MSSAISPPQRAAAPRKNAIRICMTRLAARLKRRAGARAWRALPLLLLLGIAPEAGAADPTLTLHAISGGTASLNYDWSSYEFGTILLDDDRPLSGGSDGLVVHLRKSTDAFAADEDGNSVPEGASITNSVFYPNAGTGLLHDPPASGGTKTNTSLRFEGLEVGATFEARIRQRSLDAGASGPWSPRVSAVTIILVPPSKPVEVGALAAGSGELTLTWRTPSSGGTPERYRYRWSNDGNDSTWESTGGATGVEFTLSGAEESHTLTMLRGGAAYSVQIQAVNTAGAGAWSDSASGTPIALPAATTGLTASAADGALSMAWTPPDNGGSALTGYYYRWSDDGDDSGWESAGAAAGVAIAGSAGFSNYNIPSLTNGTAYAVQVAAGNALGLGTWSLSAGGTPSRAPDAPSGVSAEKTSTAGELAVSWTAPANTGGAAISGYRYRWSDNGDDSNWQSAGGAGDTLTGLAGLKSYVVQVAAANVSGDSAWTAAAAAAMPLSAPDAPGGFRVTAGAAQLTLGWIAPSLNGGAAITGYRYRWSNNGNDSDWESAGGADGVAISGATSIAYTIISLTNGTLYAVQVAAENSVGAGRWSESVRGKPVGVPGVPREVAADSTDGGLVVRWQPPADLGGASPGELSYQVRWRAASASGFDNAHIADAAAGATNHALSGLSNGTAYVVQVRAVSAGGRGAWSADVSGTPSDFDFQMLDGVSGVSGADGILAARYLAGVRGATLVAGLGLAERIAATASANIAANLSQFDVDGVNGTTAADGILIARYVLGVTSGAGLYAGQAAAAKESAIITNIGNLLP